MKKREGARISSALHLIIYIFGEEGDSIQEAWGGISCVFTHFKEVCTGYSIRIIVELKTPAT
jgi:hypothetical protein